MKKLLLVLLALVPLACQTAVAPATQQQQHEIKPDVSARLAKLPKTVITFDQNQLTAEERQVVQKLIEASKFIDEIYWRQVSEENPAYRDELQRRASNSQLERDAYELFLAHKGRWDRLDEDEPFIGPFGAAGHKPEGAAFYPADLTKEELERYTAAHPEAKDSLQGLFTVVRRKGDLLVAIPYSQHYKQWLDPAAARIREAAAITSDASLRNYLTKLADALGKDNYRESDMAWMDLAGRLEVIIGPYEVYEDALFNYKAAYESFITVVDKTESDRLKIYTQHLPAMERNLPIPDEYKNPNRGTESPIKVVQQLYTAGDARRGVQTAAFNLPNDEVVREQKGSKKVMLKNVMDAKFRLSGQPIALRTLDPAQRSLLSFDAYFNFVLFHELSHGLGPGLITQPNGERVDVRFLLKDTYSSLEECKADVLGVWNILYAQDNKLLTDFNEQQLFATYLGLFYRSMRFGIDEAHGRGTAVQWNWLRENGAIRANADGTFTADFAKMRDGIKSLATELLTIQATGDYARAQRLLAKYGVGNSEIESTIARLTDIPTDITPVFPAAGER